MKLDPVDYAVISQGLIAAAREMGTKLVRSAYSTIMREAQDASAALFDRDGNVVAQAELIPMQLGPMSEIFRACAAVHPVDTLREGDFYINNDPYGGGQHLQDVFIYSPIFYKGELVAFAGTVAHHLDLGGGNPGLTPDAVDVHAEGIIFPPSVYNYARDWNGGPLSGWSPRTSACRRRPLAISTPSSPPMRSARSASVSFAQRYGTAVVRTAMGDLIDYSERRFRAALTEIPDGVYHGEDAVDDDGLSDKPLTVKATVTVRGSNIAVDFTGTCPQVTRNLNCPLASTISASISAIKSALTIPRHPLQRGSEEAHQGHSAEGLPRQSELPGPGARADARSLSLLQRRAEGAGAGGAGSVSLLAATTPPT